MLVAVKALKAKLTAALAPKPISAQEMAIGAKMAFGLTRSQAIEVLASQVAEDARETKTVQAS